ncbi:MAG: GNAT family N-acetyltransferase [Caulobacterales bacterium]
MTITIRRWTSGAGAICKSILDQLPEWFGQPESNANYAQLAEHGPAWLAVADGEAGAIMLLKPHFESAVEIYLLAVRPDRHRSGLGRALIDRAEAFAAESDARFLTVKTLGPSDPYEPYERTRAFYRAMGFVALEEFLELWGPENPTLFMAKALGR